MTVERADLSTGLRLDHVAPVASAPAVQGQSSRQDGEDKPRHRPPPQEASAEPSKEASQVAGDGPNDEPNDGPNDEPSEEPRHRIDSLA
jgi:hypothetical protein